MAAIGAALCVAVAGCSSSGSSGDDASPSRDTATTTGGGSGSANSSVDVALHNLLPSSVKSSGTLRIGTTTINPPMDFTTDAGEPQGVDIDLARAAAKVLGVQPKFTESVLNGLIAGEVAGRWDIMWPGMNDTAQREKQVTEVDYVKHAFSVAVRAGNPKHITSTADFCGLTFGEVQGSVFQARIPEISAQECAAKGKPAIKVDTFPDSSGTYQAVGAGRVDAVLDAQELNAYQAQKSSRIEALNGVNLSPVHYGIGIKPGATNLIKAMQGAVDVLIKNGTYQQILDKWKLGFMAIPHALINHPDAPAA